MEVDLGSKHARFVYSIRMFKPLKKKKKKIRPKMLDLFFYEWKFVFMFFFDMLVEYDMTWW